MKKKFLLSSILLVYVFAIGTIRTFAATTIVNVSTVSELQSTHNYSNNMNTTWVYTHPTTADSLEITFSSDTATEAKYDYIYILDGNDNQIGKYDGTTLAGKTITVTGNVVKIRLTSDGSQVKYGFRVTNINAKISTAIVSKGTCGDNLTWQLDDKGVLTIAGTGSMTEFSTMPWNSYKSNIKEVVVGDNVTSISKSAFRGYSSLKKVTIGKNVSQIGDSAFLVCRYIENINWNAISVSDFDDENTIFDSCGENGDGIEVIFGDSVKHIPAYAFYSGEEDYEDVNIVSVQFGKNTISIGRDAFRRCNLTSLYIPDSITTIGDYAFYSNSIADISIGSALTNVGINAFTATTSYTVSSSNQTYSSADGVLFNKNKTTLLQYPQKKADTSYTIPSGVVKINDGAFSRSNNLQSVIIPSTVTELGGSAFASCNSLTNVSMSE